MGMLGGWAKAVEPDAVVPLWPGDGLPPGVTVKDPQNQKPDAHGLIRRMDKPELRVFLPPADRATGTAVIICPGGGYGLLDYKAHVAEFRGGLPAARHCRDRPALHGPHESRFGLDGGAARDPTGPQPCQAMEARPAEDRHARLLGGRAPVLNLISHADDGDPQAKDPLDRLSCRPNFVVLMCPWNTWKLDKYPLKAPLPPVFLACRR